MVLPLAAALALLLGWLFTSKTPGTGKGSDYPFEPDFAGILSYASYLSSPP